MFDDCYIMTCLGSLLNNTAREYLLKAFMRDPESKLDESPSDERRRTISGTTYAELNDELFITSFNVVIYGGFGWK